MGPQAKKTKLAKPDKTVYCPISRQPIRVKDLMEVQWTETRDPDEKKQLISREERYQCAVTGDILNNASQCAVIRTTGHVVTKDCVEKIIKKVIGFCGIFFTLLKCWLKWNRTRKNAFGVYEMYLKTLRLLLQVSAKRRS